MLLLAWFRLRGGVISCLLVESTAADRAAVDKRRWGFAPAGAGGWGLYLCLKTFVSAKTSVDWSRRLCQPP